MSNDHPSRRPRKSAASLTSDDLAYIEELGGLGDRERAEYARMLARGEPIPGPGEHLVIADFVMPLEYGGDTPLVPLKAADVLKLKPYRIVEFLAVERLLIDRGEKPTDAQLEALIYPDRISHSPGDYVRKRIRPLVQKLMKAGGIVPSTPDETTP